MTAEQAQLLAVRALSWLVGQEDVWRGFLAETGIDAAAVRGAAAEPGFLLAVLDHLMRQDRWVVAFCDAEGIGYAEPMTARVVLAGGPDPHWT